jgi:hypothetical protein
MDAFIIHIGKIKFHIEPAAKLKKKENDPALGQFRVYEDDNVFVLNEEKVDDIPPGHLMGILTVNDVENPKDFDFNGGGKISGEELVQITQMIIQHFDEECA